MPSIDLTMTSDTQLVSDHPTTNYENGVSLGVGESNLIIRIVRSILVPDFSSVAGYVITAATLKLTPSIDFTDNARTMYAHRILRSVVTTQATWDIYSTGNNWGTAGCKDSTNDYDGAVVLGSATQPSNPSIGSAGSFTMALDATEMQKFNDGTYTNNGIILFVDTEDADLTFYDSKESTTPNYRPIITVTYKASINNFFGLVKNRRNRRSQTVLEKLQR